MYKLSQRFDMDAFLVGEDGSGDCESDEDIKVSDLAQEVSCRTILHWNYRGLVSLPSELLRYGSHVEELYLKENQIEELPDTLSKSLPMLRNIYICRNYLLKLPNDIGNIQFLTVLDVSKNRLSDLPSSLPLLRNLKTLDISQNLLTSLNESLFEIESLEFLVAVGNRVQKIPSSIDNLRNLRGLYLSSNQLSCVPSSLSRCVDLQECYLDNNQLVTIPDCLTSLPELNIMSLANNSLVTLPCLPWVSCARLMLDNNPRLHHLTYLTGCHQSIISYSSQASWAAMAGPLALNILAGVWNIRLYGCGEDIGVSETVPGEEEPLLTLTSSSGKPISLPPRLRKVCDVPSLLEMSLRQVYKLVTPRMSVSVTVTEDVHLYIPSVTIISEDGLGLDQMGYQLPVSLLQRLRSGPASVCCRPACLGPIFSECHLRLLETGVQRSWLGGGNVEMRIFLASLLYCSLACFHGHLSDSLYDWESEMLARTTRPL